MMLNRRKWLSAVAFGAVSAAAYPVLGEPYWLELSHTNIQLGSKLSRPIRILHLADLHASSVVPLLAIDHAVNIGLEQNPDLICLTGDFISNRSGFDPDNYIRSLKKLSAAAPAFAVLGNHDGGSWATLHRGFRDHRLVEQILAESGIILLHNRSRTVRVNNSDLHLVGVGDLWSEEIDATAAFSQASGGVPTVLLSHNPDSKDVLSQCAWHLMLSGHTHGGQVIVPFEGPCFAPVVDKRFVAGLGQWRDRQIYVTRGVGNLGGIRFCCRPEASLLSLS